MAATKNVENFLAHHGIKGMKWGVRRLRGKNGRVSTERKRADKVLEKKKTHGRRALTNKDLADYNKRLELEKKFDKLNEKPPRNNPITQGHNFAKALLGIGVTANAAIAFSKTPAGQRLVASIRTMQNEGAAARAARAAARTAARHTPVRPLMLNP